MPTNGEPVHPATVSAEGISYPDRLLAAYLDAVARAPQGRCRALYDAARGAANGRRRGHHQRYRGRRADPGRLRRWPV